MQDRRPLLAARVAYAAAILAVPALLRHSRLSEDQAADVAALVLECRAAALPALEQLALACSALWKGSDVSLDSAHALLAAIYSAAVRQSRAFGLACPTR